MGDGMEERIIYLDNSATTPLSMAAREKITETLDVFGNPSSLHAAGDKAANAQRAARRSVLSALGIRYARGVVASGDVFVATDEKRSFIREHFGASAP